MISAEGRPGGGEQHHGLRGREQVAEALHEREQAGEQRHAEQQVEHPDHREVQQRAPGDAAGPALPHHEQDEGDDEGAHRGRVDEGEHHEPERAGEGGELVHGSIVRGGERAGPPPLGRDPAEARGRAGAAA